MKASFVCYVGNRLHILFKSAGTVILLPDHLTSYLSRFCAANKLRAAILPDIQNPAIRVQLQVLGLLGKVMSKPWMGKFYANRANKKNLEMEAPMKAAIAQLKTFVNNPSELLTCTHDVFGCPIEVDKELDALRREPKHSQFDEVAQKVFGSTIEVLERQLKRYLEGDLSQPTDEMLDICSSASLINFHAERLLGRFSAQFARAPNATTGFLDGKTKVCKN